MNEILQTTVNAIVSQFNARVEEAHGDVTLHVLNNRGGGGMPGITG